MSSSIAVIALRVAPSVTKAIAAGRKALKSALFEDNFESATPAKEWHNVVPTFVIENGVLKGTQTRDKEVPAADGKPAVPAHAAVYGLDVPTKDSVVEVKIKFAGATMVNVEFDDRKFTGSHYGHLCRAQVRPASVTIVDERDGNQNEEIKAMRADPAKKAEVAERMKGKQAGAWLAAILAMAGVMAVAPVATFGDPAPPAEVGPTRTIELADKAGAIAFGPGGRTVLSADNKAIRIFDVKTGREMTSVPSSDDLSALVLAPDEKCIAAGGETKDLSLLDPATAKSTQTFTLSGFPYSASLAWSTDGHQLACAAAKKIQVWDVTGGKVKAEWAPPEDRDVNIAFSPDASKLAGCRNGGGPGPFDGTVFVWEAGTGKLVSKFITSAANHSWVCFLDAGTIITPDDRSGGAASAIDISTGKAKYGFNSGAVGQTFTAGAVSHDHTLLVTGDAGAGGLALVQLWDARTGRLLATLKGHKDEHVTRLVFAPDDSAIASASNDKTIRLWPVPGRQAAAAPAGARR